MPSIYVCDVMLRYGTGCRNYAFARLCYAMLCYLDKSVSAHCRGMNKTKTKLIILNSPANPTGGVDPKTELEKLAKGLLDYPNVYILSDEIYSRILFDEHKHHSLKSLYVSRNVKKIMK